MLFNIMRLIPKSTSDLFPIMSTRFPFYHWDRDILVWYTKQCFRVLEYLPSIGQRVLELLIDKSLEIDVNIFIKDNGDAVIDEEEATAKEVADDDGDERMENQSDKKVESVDILSDKLDALLGLLFDHIKARCVGGASNAQLAFSELLPIFESSILTTHKSKVCQTAEDAIFHHVSSVR